MALLGVWFTLVMVLVLVMVLELGRMFVLLVPQLFGAWAALSSQLAVAAVAAACAAFPGLQSC